MLNTRDSAQKVVLRALYNTRASLKYEPSLEEIIKLKVARMSEDPEVEQASIQALSIWPDFETTLDKIRDFDLLQFITEHPKEFVDKLCALTNEIIVQQKCARVLFEKMIDAANQLHKEKASEESLLFFPTFLTINIDQMEAGLFAPVYRTIIEKYCSDND